MLIGVTGSLGTGKTTVAGIFAGVGANVIDADVITRDLLGKNGKCIKKVAKIFPDVILKSGDVDRAKLAKVVFQNPRELNKLTDILYPEALKEVKRQVSLYKKKPLVILDAPLLFEAGWDKLTDTTIVVRALRSQQIERTHTRAGLTKAEFTRRLKLQMPLKDKCVLADIVIDNGGTIKETRDQVSAIINRLLKRKSKTRRNE